jgi:hypothetical protein
MKYGRLFNTMLMLFALTGTVVAQPVMPPPADVAEPVTVQHADIQATVAATKSEAKTSRATREQIQALRLALKAKLAAMHH